MCPNLAVYAAIVPLENEAQQLQIESFLIVTKTFSERSEISYVADIV